LINNPGNTNMKTYISLLRGINVSGKNLIKMAALKEMYEKLGFNNVTTFIQSGNVVFTKEETSTAELEKLISEEIFKCFGKNVPLIVKEKTRLKRILKENPFLKAQVDTSSLYITFLSAVPGKQSIENIGKTSFLPDEYRLTGSEIYLHLPNGAGRTKLNNNFFENKLKVNATSRNLNTLTELLKIAESM
jgi:uncharacterized protein (DUF1697 family)